MAEARSNDHISINETAASGRGTCSPFSSHPAPPSFPKAGGALQSTSEQFDLHGPTGKCTLKIPLPATPGRNASSPNLDLLYDSARGNGPFGIGWNVNLMQISRSTSRGVPRYDESDVFSLQTETGSDDLVLLPPSESNGLVFENYSVRQYETRLFKKPMRLLQLTNVSDNRDTHWQYKSGDNVLSLMGTDAESVIIAPGSGEIFRWFLKRSEDCYGNVVEYQYRSEDDLNVAVATVAYSRVCSSNRYLESVRYGNESRKMNLKTTKTHFYFEVFFNYSSLHSSDAESLMLSGGNPNDSWACRKDPFSNYRSGFEIRTYRLCQNILFLHHFKEERGMQDPLVRSLDLVYKADFRGTQLESLTITGHRNGQTESIPTSTFKYMSNRPPKRDSLRSMQLTLPPGVRSVRWIDLDGTGIPSLLAEGPKTLYVKRNLTVEDDELCLAEWEDFTPAIRLKDGQIIDFDGDGRLEYVNYKMGFSRRQNYQWDDLQGFTQISNIDLDASRTKLVDLTGSGSRDIVSAGINTISWFECKKDQGFSEPKAVRFDDESPDIQPSIIASQPNEKLYFADMSGDGLIDIVRVRNGSISYFPNTGYGSFGSMIVMENAPIFEALDRFDYQRLLLWDLDGTGVSDLVYLDTTGDLKIYLNESGNSLSDVEIVCTFPSPASGTTFALADLFGNGATCAVSCDLDHGIMTYIPINSCSKPCLLTSYDNGAGLETKFEYTSTARLYNQAAIRESPAWHTAIPFPVQCITRTTTHDSVSQKTRVHRYRYADGYYDHQNREFLGFGQVEEWDGPNEQCLYVRTSYLNGSGWQLCFGDVDPAVTLSSALSGEYLRHGLRALAGQVLEQTTCPADAEGQTFTSTKKKYRAHMRHSDGSRASFRITTELSQERIFELENVARVADQYILKVDEYGNTLSSLDIYYGKPESSSAAQRETRTILTENAVTNHWNNSLCFRASAIYESCQIDVELDSTSDRPRTPGGFQADIIAANKCILSAQRIVFRSDDLTGDLSKGKIGTLGLMAYTARLAFTKRHLNNFGKIFTSSDLTDAGYTDLDGDGNWWSLSPRHWFGPRESTSVELSSAQANFFLPQQYSDVFKNYYAVEYDEYLMAVRKITNPEGKSSIAEYDYRSLQPLCITEPNGISQTFEYDELGHVLREGRSSTNFKLSKLPPTRLKSTNVHDLEIGVLELIGESMRCISVDHSCVPRRIVNVSRIDNDTGSDLAIEVTFLDGSGQPCQTRRFVESGKWLVSGWVDYDNQGNIQAEYQSYYDTIPEFSIPAMQSCKTIIHDAQRRPILTVREDGAWSLTERGAWSRKIYDYGDTVGTQPPDYLSIRLKNAKRDLSMSNDAVDQVYAGTPKRTLLDCQGSEIMAQEPIDSQSNYCWSKNVSLNGQEVTLYDSFGRSCFKDVFNAQGEKFYSLSMDKGERWTLKSVDELVTKDIQGPYSKRYLFDKLRRPIRDLENERIVVTRDYYSDGSDPHNYGKLYTLTDQSGTIKFNSYDIWGNATQYSRSLEFCAIECNLHHSIPTTTILVDIQKDFDFMGRPLGITLVHSGLTLSLNWTYDALGRHTSTPGIVDNVKYDAKGHMLSVRYQNGCSKTNTYDPYSLWLKGSTTEIKGQQIQSVSFERDIMGRIRSISDTLHAHLVGKTVVEPLESRFSYDALGRLRRALCWEYPSSKPNEKIPTQVEDWSSSSSLCAYCETYEYDTESNLITSTYNPLVDPSLRQEKIRQYSYAADSHQLLEVSGPRKQLQQWRYDGPDGRLGLPSQIDQTKLQWTSAQKLQHMHDLNRDCCSIYQYNSANSRYSKCVANSSGVRQVSAFIEDFEIILLPTRQKLEVSTFRASMRIDQDLVGYLHRSNGSDSALQVTSIVTDHLGSVSLELDKAASVLSYTIYRPYGAPIPITLTKGPTKISSPDVTSVSSKQYFLGKPYEEESSLTFCENRYLSHEFYRWISPDPVGLEGETTNLYCYAHADPVNLLDRNGFCPETNNDTQLQQKSSPLKLIGYTAQAYLSYRVFNSVSNNMNQFWNPRWSMPHFLHFPHHLPLNRATAVLTTGLMSVAVLKQIESFAGPMTGKPNHDAYNDSAQIGSITADIAGAVNTLYNRQLSVSTIASGAQIGKEIIFGERPVSVPKQETETRYNNFTGKVDERKVTWSDNGAMRYVNTEHAT